MERGFSQGSLTVSKFRHNLSDNSIKASVLLSSWSKVSGIISATDVIKAFEEKIRRPRGPVAGSSRAIIINDDM